ncbi:MAG: Ig-like domain-containing protein [Chloroflexota bacterium]
MERPAGLPLVSARSSERGQIIILFAFALIAIIAMAGLLIDGGMAWSSRRQAQAAADTAALAAANAALQVGATSTTIANAARSIAGTNGFPADLIDCGGATQADAGVVVNRPPLTGAFAGKNNYIEVVTSRRVTTTFARAIGLPCFMVSARAVSAVASPSVANCSFCSLNDSYGNHTLVLKNGATLRVDGDIYVNSKDGLTGDSKVSFNGVTCVPGQEAGKDKGDFFVCGDGFDIFGAGGSITAKTISVVGGWETHDFNIASADSRATLADGTPCPLYTQPLGYSTPVANVCIGMPPIADPLNNPSDPDSVITAPVLASLSVPAANVDGCPGTALIPTGRAGVPVTMSITGVATICPGIYYGGIKVTGSNARLTMLPGIYYIAGGGFQVINGAWVDGSQGVMIYNSSGVEAVPVNTTPGTDKVPAADKNKKTPKNPNLTSNNNPSDVTESVTYTFTIERNKSSSPTPTGLMTFYDGDTAITGCIDLAVASAGTGKVAATCSQAYSNPGSRAISAVYWGDSFYNPIGDTLTQTITTPAGSAIAPITLSTTGNVKLSGPTSGAYGGLTLFQDRASNLTITINPGSGASACSGNWLTDGVPPNTNPVPAACGPLGGLQGTIYAPNQEALVLITASGVSNLQIIAGKIQVDSNADARFAYTPQFFANGNLRLVE